MMVHVLLRCSWITNGELNVSGQETGYCEDASGCNEPSRPPPVLGWQPFVTEPAKTRWIDFSKVMKVYAKWHNRTLYDATISCDEKQVLVFTPNAGLGDSVGALTSAFILAIKQGRMFFIDWKPHKWSIGIKPLPFVYEYNKASALNDDHGNPLICIPRAEWAASNIQGHVTQEHPSLSNPTINSLNVPYDNLLTSVLKPSKKVKAIIDQVLPDAPGHTDVAIVIRTGLAEYNQFLSPGDENNFVACFKAPLARQCTWIVYDARALPQKNDVHHHLPVLLRRLHCLPGTGGQSASGGLEHGTSAACAHVGGSDGCDHPRTT